MKRIPTQIATLAAVFGLAWCGSAFGASVADGQRAFDAGRYYEARRIWTALAEQGDPRAALGLGIVFDLGRGVPSDAATALGWYRAAAQGGIADAELNVGIMLDSGRGAVRDAAEAALWYARAAARGNHRAQYDLGQLYESGDGVPKNTDLAAAWFTAAASGGLSAASQRLNQLPKPEREPGGADLALLPATPVAPDANAAIERHGETDSVELVWTSPQQPAPTTFYVEALSLTLDGSEPAFGRYVATSSTLMPIHGLSGRFVWRVYVVSPQWHSYAVSGWRRFVIAQAALATR